MSQNKSKFESSSRPELSSSFFQDSAFMSLYEFCPEGFGCFVIKEIKRVGRIYLDAIFCSDWKCQIFGFFNGTNLDGCP